MDRAKKALLIGLVLGDGYLNSNSGVALEIEHAGSQKFYIEYKSNLISKLLKCKSPKLYYRTNKNTYKISKGHRYFKILKKWIYINNSKKITKKILNYLTPEAIAIWWMDDGSHSIDKRKSTGKVTAHSFHLYTYTSEEETNDIISFFKEQYNIQFYPIRRKMKTGEYKFYIKCRTKEGRKLSNLLRPYILPEFSYKIMKESE